MEAHNPNEHASYFELTTLSDNNTTELNQFKDLQIAELFGNALRRSQNN